jgi:hypothetical protein
MTDPTALAAAGVSPPEMAGAAAQQQAAVSTRFDPGETRMFASMMHGSPGAAAAPSASNGTTVFGDTAKSLAAQFSGNERSYEDLRRSMLQSVDLSDPIKTMFVMTDHSMEAHMMFAKMHISTGLASAATSLFGTLLKNQQ